MMKSTLVLIIFNENPYQYWAGAGRQTTMKTRKNSNSSMLVTTKFY